MMSASTYLSGRWVDEIDDLDHITPHTLRENFSRRNESKGLILESGELPPSVKRSAKLPIVLF